MIRVFGAVTKRKAAQAWRQFLEKALAMKNHYYFKSGIPRWGWTYGSKGVCDGQFGLTGPGCVGRLTGLG